jgi:hypothetical protein
VWWEVPTRGSRGPQAGAQAAKPGDIGKRPRIAGRASATPPADIGERIGKSSGGIGPNRRAHLDPK